MKIAIVAAVVLFWVGAGGWALDVGERIGSCDVSWDSPSADSAGSMPIGNGDLGANVWVEKNRDLVFYVSKTDAWGDDVAGPYGLAKVGRVRVRVTPELADGTRFRQTLKLMNGEILIEEGDRKIRVWVDANSPVIRVEVESGTAVQVEAAVETYRKTATKELNADRVFAGLKDRVAWCYRNRAKDGPLKGLTFGAGIEGEGFGRVDDSTVKSARAGTKFALGAYVLTARAESEEAWLGELDRVIRTVRKIDLESARTKHAQWWRDFWNRSWIFVDGDEAAKKVTQQYVLQRYVTACAGRGAYPIKFNGSIFTVDATANADGKPTRVNGDYRTWGGDYWFQNTRAMYWPMLASGDFEMMRPLFAMYQGMLEGNRRSVQGYYRHGGAYFCETSPFWGGLPNLTAESPGYYIGHYYTPILELSAMMLDYYAYTGDEKFARETLVPIADAGLTFFDEHFSRDEKGKMVLSPDNAIETYWKVKNPGPDVAGLTWVLGRLLETKLGDEGMRARWKRMLVEAPDLPLGIKDGKKVLMPFEAVVKDGEIHNSENPELYAIYPFRIFGTGKSELQMARDTFTARRVKQSGCWCQDPIQAAYLGDGELARADVIGNFSRTAEGMRFPAFWTAGNDYAPDEDNGGNAVNALQLMVMQCEGKRILLAPAWAKKWDVSFRLHGPLGIVVEGEIRGGEVRGLKVTPEQRRGDVEIVH